MVRESVCWSLLGRGKAGGVTSPSLSLWEGTPSTLARCPKANFSSLPSEMTRCQESTLLEQDEG